jgi:predicted lipoprotein with Yx(FWY)xxD motif
MKTKQMLKRTIAPMVIGAAAVLALAACGSSSKATVSPGAQPNASTSTIAGSATPVVKTGTTAKLGAVLVDGKGMTLYTLTKNGAPVACSGQCAMNWPPLLVPAGTVTVPAAAGVNGLGTAPGTGGTQVTAAHLPLYRFSGDSAAGDTNGNGITAFGGVWHVVMASASSEVAPAPTPAPAATSPTTAASGYGY